MRPHITLREKCGEGNWMSGECYGLHHTNAQVFPSRGDNKFPSAPSGASRPFCWFSLTLHCLIKAKGIHDLYLRDRSCLYGFKLVPLSKRDLPLSLTLSCSLHGAVCRVTPLAAFLRDFPCMEFGGWGQGALLSPCFCGYFTFLTKKDLQQGSHFFSYK